jgi:hypothetical protein
MSTLTGVINGQYLGGPQKGSFYRIFCNVVAVKLLYYYLSIPSEQ